MKLAEALANRADLQRRIEQMRGGFRRAPSSRRVRARRRTLRSSSMRRRGSSPSSRGMYGASTDEPLRDARRRRDDAHGRPGTPRRHDAALRDPQDPREYGTSDRLPRYGGRRSVSCPPWR